METEIKRMHQPEDTLIKRQAAFAEKTTHEYFKLPGKYLGPCKNELPSAMGSIKKMIQHIL